MNEEEEEKPKKRKVSLKVLNCQEVDFSKKKKKHKQSSTSPKRILMDPFLRMMDEYLIQYHESGPSLISIMDKILETFYNCNKKKIVDHVCSNGMGYILHGAALWNDTNSTQLALQLGIDIYLKDSEGRTAYQIASLVGNPEIMNALKEFDPNVSFCVENKEDYVYDFYYLDQQDNNVRKGDTK